MTQDAPIAPRGWSPRGALMIALLHASCTAPAIWEPRPELSLDLGGVRASDTEALLGGFGLTFPVAEHWTLGARIAAYDFEMSASGTLEVEGIELEAGQRTTGTGLGGGAELRFYPRRALDGFWFGGGALYFPWTDFESRGEARDPFTGERLTLELEPERVEFVPYGALGWTFRIRGPFSLGLRASVGKAAGEAFGTFGLQLGLAL